MPAAKAGANKENSLPRSLAAGHRRVTILTKKPADMKAPTLAELNAGIHASCRILASGYSLNPGTSETVEEGSLCDQITPKVMTNGTFDDGSMTVFRYFDSTQPGKAEVVTGTPSGDEIGDAVFQAVKTRGTPLWFADRFTGKKATDAWAGDDEARVFEVQTDAPRQADAEGYIKAEIALVIQNAELDAKVAAATP